MLVNLKQLVLKNQSYGQVRMERNGNMNMISSQKQGRVPVTVLELTGKLDGSNYKQLLEETRKLYLEGTRHLLIDLTELTFMSSAGIAAIHQTALIFRGQPLADEETGWAAYHSIDRDRGSGVQNLVKLLCPQNEVANILDIAAFDSLFEIYHDLDTAVASFQ